MVNAVINLFVIVIWVFGYCFAIATQNSEIYCGGK